MCLLTYMKNKTKQESTANQTINDNPNLIIALNNELATLQYKGYRFKNKFMETAKGIVLLITQKYLAFKFNEDIADYLVYILLLILIDIVDWSEGGGSCK